MSSGFHPFGGRVSRHFGDNLAPNDPYLSYHDVQLTKEDVECIKDDWLTDNAISFWEEYLEHETLSDYPKAKIVLLRPSMVFLLKETPEPTSLASALPSFAQTTHVFLPINDNSDPSRAEGGTHWSLLVVSLTDAVAFHYDSMLGANMYEARKVTAKFERLLGAAAHAPARARLRFWQVDESPQQENGRDCGVFVCLLMDYLLRKRLLRCDARSTVSMDVDQGMVDATRGRKKMVRTIDDFRREAKRRSSRSPSPYMKENPKSPPRIGDEQNGLDSRRSS